MPQNEGYYHAAYALSAIVYAAYAASIWWRGRKVERRER
jgi:hypothetical protein